MYYVKKKVKKFSCLPVCGGGFDVSACEQLTIITEIGVADVHQVFSSVTLKQLMLNCSAVWICC